MIMIGVNYFKIIIKFKFIIFETYMSRIDFKIEYFDF